MWALKMSEVEGIVQSLKVRRSKIKIIEVEGVDAEKLYSYLRLLRKAEDAEELFENISGSIL